MPRAFAPQQLGKYTLLRKIATGGMAEVFLARSEGAAGFQKTLVIKKILPNLAEDVGFVEMFLNEARVASQLNHPNVVSIYELGEIDGAYYIAMEYIDGPNLRGLSRRTVEAGKRLEVPVVCKIISLAADGLQYAHDAVGHDGQPINLIHRDISPDNILVTRQGAVKVVDFGIAKAANQPHLTKSGMLKGKLSYMPPEQIRGHALDRRADLFALGVCFYELLAGAKPFESTSEVAVMQAILHQPPAPITSVRPDVDADLVAILEKALAKDRDQRYESCGDFQAALDGYLIKRQVNITARDLARVVEDVMGPAVPLTTSNPELKAVDGKPASSEQLVAKGGTPPPWKPAAGSAGNALIASSVDIDMSATRSDVKMAAELAAANGGKTKLIAGLLAGGALVLGGVIFFLARPSNPDVESVAVKPLDAKPSVSKPADPKPADPKPAEAKPANPRTAVAALGTTGGAAAPTPTTVNVAPKPVGTPKPVDPPKAKGGHTVHASSKDKHKNEVASAATPAPAPAPPPAANGKIEIRVVPFAEDVIVDGKHWGPTPVSPDVASGKHHVVLVRQSEKFEQDVVVPGNGSAVIKHKFNAE